MISAARLEFHFMNWRRWMRAGTACSGYPGKSAGFVAGGYSASFDDLVDASDLRCAEVVDAVVGGLPAPERWAIHSEYLDARVRTTKEEFLSALERARRSVCKGLFDRGIF